MGAAERHQGGAVQQPEVSAAGVDALSATSERARLEGAVTVQGHSVGAVHGGQADAGDAQRMTGGAMRFDERIGGVLLAPRTTFARLAAGAARPSDVALL